MERNPSMSSLAVLHLLRPQIGQRTLPCCRDEIMASNHLLRAVGRNSKNAFSPCVPLYCGSITTIHPPQPPAKIHTHPLNLGSDMPGISSRPRARADLGTPKATHPTLRTHSINILLASEASLHSRTNSTILLFYF